MSTESLVATWISVYMVVYLLMTCGVYTLNDRYYKLEEMLFMGAGIRAMYATIISWCAYTWME